MRSGKSEAEYRAALEATIEESDGLIRTFNALLMIARAESGQARDAMIEFDAAEIARGVGELYEPLADEKGLALKIEAGRDAAGARQSRTGDARRSPIWSTTPSNMPRRTTPTANGAPAEIVVEASGEGDRIRLSVSRSAAPAFPQADRARVVERFVRLEQSRSEPGSGLGLSLASAVAQLHGGELRLEDNEPGLKATLRAAARRAAIAAAERIVNRRQRGYDRRMARSPETPDRKRRQAAHAQSASGRQDARWRSALADAPRLVGPQGRARARRANGWPRSARSAAGKALKRAARRRVRRSKRCWTALPTARRISGTWRRAEPARLLRCCNADPDEHLAALAGQADEAVAAAKDEAAGDAAAAPHEGGSGAADRARRYRRRLAGDAGDAGADRTRRHGRSRRGALPAARGRGARAAQARRPARPEEGSGYIVLAMGKMGAFELNYSSDIDLIVFYDPDAPALAGQGRRHRVLRAHHARPGEASAGAHRRRLRVPRRSAAAARSGLDPDRGLDRRRRSTTTTASARTGSARR